MKLKKPKPKLQPVKTVLPVEASGIFKADRAQLITTEQKPKEFSSTTVEEPT